MEQEQYFSATDVAEMADWANTELGVALDWEELKHSDMSIVLKGLQKGQDKDRVLFLKSANRAAAFEAALTQYLAQHFPDMTVRPLALDTRRNRMLLEELPGVLLRTTRDVDAYREMIRRYAHIQQKTAAMTDELLQFGLGDRRLPVLYREIDTHLEALCATGLDDARTAEILDLKDELLGMCREMEGVLPDTIDHGDLHSGNVYRNGKDFLFFDWGDASLTHPFLGVRVFWNSLYELNDEDTEENWFNRIAGFRPVYLDMWKEYATEDVLRRQLYYAEQIGCLYRALSWHLYITPFRINRDESYGKPAQWLELLLDHRRFFRSE